MVRTCRQFAVLPWDDWGQRPAAYQGRTGEDYDALLDEVAAAIAADDEAAIQRWFDHPDLAVHRALLD